MLKENLCHFNSTKYVFLFFYNLLDVVINLCNEIFRHLAFSKKHSFFLLYNLVFCKESSETQLIENIYAFLSKSYFILQLTRYIY